MSDERAAPPPAPAGGAAESSRRAAPGSLALTGLLILAAGYTLYFGRVFFLPLFAAAYLALLFRPIVRHLRGWRIPEALGAFLVVGTLVTALVGTGMVLRGPAQDWIEGLPATLDQAGRKMQGLRRPLDRVARATEAIEQTVSPKANGRVVEVSGPRLGTVALDVTQQLLLGLVEVVALLYVMLATGETLLDRVAGVFRDPRHRTTALAIARDAQRSFSRYLGTFALINGTFGLCVGLAMLLLGMPHPMLWGALAALFEFVPFIGMLSLFVLATLTALVTFNDSVHLVAIPLVLLGLNFTVENLVAPFVFGRRLLLHPVVVLVSVLFWYWLWGVAGAFLAVPMLVFLGALAEHVPALAPLGGLVGERQGRRILLTGLEDSRTHA